MTTLLQRSQQAWRDIGGLHTAEEIAQQPALWSALATTTLLTHPELYLDASAPTLLVSFARSGDSQESLAAVNLVRELVPGARLLNITCNAGGRLAVEGADDPNTFTLLMPAASCDRGFAMTSSFTCMLLAALGVLGKGDQLDRIAALSQLAERALLAWEAPVAALGGTVAERVVYLGSGPLEGLAKESALKLLELTGGRVTAMANTPLGFRHGPKSVLNGESVVFVFNSGRALSRRYEADLVEEVRRDGIARRILTIGPGGDIDIDTPSLSDAWLAPLWLLFAQQYALHLSATLQLTPDNPFASGTVNRVVKGVTIYRHDAS